MSRVIEDRALLISAMETARESIANDNPPRVYGGMSCTALLVQIDVILAYVKGNANKHLLSTSKEVDFAVSFDIRCTDSETKRVRTTLGRYIRRGDITHLSISDGGLAEFVTRVHGALATVEDKIKIITGENIPKAYEGFCGADSCMTGMPAQRGGLGNKMLALYSENPDKVAMVLFQTPSASGGYARALLWTTDQGEKILDRIYPNGGAHVLSMQQWAAQQGYLYRRESSAPVASPIRVSDDKIHTVSLKRPSSGVIPYLDTFCWGNISDSVYVLSNDLGDYEWDFRSTTGKPKYAQNYAARCAHCACKIMASADVYEFDNRPLCRTCAEKVSWACECCLLRIPNDEPKLRMRTHSARLRVCKNCVEQYSRTCASCGEIHDLREAGNIRAIRDGTWLCRTCSTTCTDCLEICAKSGCVSGVCSKCRDAAAADAREAHTLRVRFGCPTQPKLDLSKLQTDATLSTTLEEFMSSIA